MAIHWQIPFKSLRNATDYTVNIYDSTFSGDPVILKGGANPFTTQEKSDEDMFIPIRTQTGYLRIVDDGKDANGASWNWKTLLPSTDTDRPVTLTDGNGTVVWQGFMQSQNFGGQLYGNPQEREFPVQCPLSVLSSVQAPTDQTGINNFAYLMQYIFQRMATQSPLSTPFTSYVFQGGADARRWLQKIFDWHNFLMENDDGITARYTLYQILEDVCRFWGWTCRVWRQQIFFTCADDQNESNALVLDNTTIGTLASNISGTSTAGSIETMFTTKTVGDIFATTEVSDMVARGVSRAEVKADCNESSSLVEFAPQTVRNEMESNGYTWVNTDPDNSTVGYFTTPKISSFNAMDLKGTVSSSSFGGFCRRQIYTDNEASDANICDMITIVGNYDGSKYVRLETTRARIFSGGSLKMSGTLYEGSSVYTNDDRLDERNMLMSIGIGETYNTAKWFFLTDPMSTLPNYGWSSTKSELRVLTTFSLAYETALSPLIPVRGDYPAIPVEDNMYGKVFIEFLGCDSLIGISDDFQIANFKIEYSRDAEQLLSIRSRTLQIDRKSTQKYTATNQNKCDEKWNADCIFASDNNMEYGYGLIMNPADGSTDAGKFMTKAIYGGSSSQYPEQHLANRVTSFWSRSRRVVSAPLLSNGLCGDVAAINVGPRHKMTIDGTTCHTIAISQDWQDDITKLTLLEA